MALQLNPYTVPLVALVVVDLVLATLSLRRRDAPGAVGLGALMLVVGISTTFYVLMLDVTTLRAKLGFMRASFVFSALIPVAWLWFGIQFTGRERWANRTTLALLSVEPVVLLLVMLTPPSWDLVLVSSGLDRTGDLVTLTSEPGIWMTIHFSYHYVVFAVGTLLFLAMFVRARHLYRAQAGAMLVGALIPWAGNALYLSGLFDVIHLFPILVTAAGVAFTLALYRFQLLDPVPTARETIVDEMGDGVLVLDREGRVGDANPAVASLLTDGGSDGQSLVGQHVSDLLDGWATIAAAEDEWQEIAIDVADETKYLEVEVTSFEDHHDRTVGRLVVLRDVTRRKRRETTLARYKTIFKSIQDRVYVLDADDRFTMVNEPFAAMLGYEPDQLEGRHVSSIVGSAPAGTGDHDDGSLASRFDTDERNRFEFRAVTADGEEIPSETELSPITFGGADEGTVGVIRDISRRRKAERSLRETSHRLQTLVEASPLATISIDADGVVDVWNPAAERIFGFDADEAVGKRPPFVPASGDTGREAYASVETSLLEGETIRGFELELSTRDGESIDASVSGAPIYDVEESVAGAVLVVADVTDRKERERRLRRQNEKLEQFASTLTHDLRNPLSVAQGFTDVAREREDEEAFDRIESAHDRMSRIIDDLLTLARQGETVDETRRVDLGSVVRDAWEVVETAEMRLEVEGTRTVEADRDRFQAVLENLLRNAREHAGEDASVWVGATEDGFFVEDGGPGIPEDERGEVFDHGFTTADDGTGFGLSIVQEVVEAHGWSIEVTAGRARGARFEVRTGLGPAGRELEGSGTELQTN